MSRGKRYVPGPNDPTGFDDFLVSMAAYWRYWWILRKGGMKKKLSVTVIIGFCLDYMRLWILRYYL